MTSRQIDSRPMVRVVGALAGLVMLVGCNAPEAEFEPVRLADCVPNNRELRREYDEFSAFAERLDAIENKIASTGYYADERESLLLATVEGDGVRLEVRTGVILFVDLSALPAEVIHEIGSDPATIVADIHVDQELAALADRAFASETLDVLDNPNVHRQWYGARWKETFLPYLAVLRRRDHEHRQCVLFENIYFQADMARVDSGLAFAARIVKRVAREADVWEGTAARDNMIKSDLIMLDYAMITSPRIPALRDLCRFTRGIPGVV